MPSTGQFRLEVLRLLEPDEDDDFVRFDDPPLLALLPLLEPRPRLWRRLEEPDFDFDFEPAFALPRRDELLLRDFER